jgi:hypothetical protein
MASPPIRKSRQRPGLPLFPQEVQDLQSYSTAEADISVARRTPHAHSFAHGCVRCSEAYLQEQQLAGAFAAHGGGSNGKGTTQAAEAPGKPGAAGSKGAAGRKVRTSCSGGKRAPNSAVILPAADFTALLSANRGS